MCKVSVNLPRSLPLSTDERLERVIKSALIRPGVTDEGIRFKRNCEVSKILLRVML